MGWIPSQFRTCRARRSGWMAAAVVTIVLILHGWLVGTVWSEPGLAMRDKPSGLIHGQLLLERLVHAPVSTVLPSPQTPTPPSAPSALPERPLDPPPPSPTDDAFDTSTADQAADNEAPSIEPVEEPVDEPAPVLHTQHLANVSSLWRYRVEAQTKGRQIFANATLQWSLEGDQYRAEAVVSALFLGQRRQVSEGRLGLHGVEPTTFTDEARRTRELLFDWDARAALRNGDTIQKDLPLGTQDPLSVFMQLTTHLINNPLEPTLGQQWRIPVMGLSRLEHWDFVFQGQSLKRLPAGTFVAWHLQRQPGPEDRQPLTVDLWLAPVENFMPVRIRYSEDNGDVIDQRLSRFE